MNMNYVTKPEFLLLMGDSPNRSRTVGSNLVRTRKTDRVKITQTFPL